MRGFRDRDFLQTKDGFFFCVVGQVHPPNRIISYIKYVPSETGLWSNGQKKYGRIFRKYTIPDLIKTFNFLEKNYPQYMFYSPVDKITLTAVPYEYITKHFQPEMKLAKLKQTKNLDSLQIKLIRFTKFLEEISNLPERSFGVTGSLLLDIHDPSFSDLDLVVYGREESWKLKKALTENSRSELIMKRLNGTALKNWCIKKTKQYPLSFKEALDLYGRKWNLGIFENKWVSIHPVKLDKEIRRDYGQETYCPSGQVTIEASVTDNSDSIFLPAIYEVNDVNFLKGNPVDDVTKIVSYEGLYDSLADNDERIEVRGKLEKVVNQEKNQIYYRVVVGSSEGKGKEYIKLKE